MALGRCTGGWLGVGNDPRYSKSRVFDPFPFPDADHSARHAIAENAEELDATRKQVLAENADLTLTGLYNLRDKIAAGEPLNPVEQDQRVRGRIDIIAELHRRIDAAVARAYLWSEDLSDEEIVTHLVALNAERARKERAGQVRWLRPAYQLDRRGVEWLGDRGAAGSQIEAALEAPATRKPPFPRDALGQTAAVLHHLRAGQPMTAATIAALYSQGQRAAPRIEATLAALARLGHVAAETGEYRLKQAA